MRNELTSVQENRVIFARRKRAELSARILSTAGKKINLLKLSERLSLPKSDLIPFVQFLEASGFLAKVSGDSPTSYERTKLGSRFLRTLIELHRMQGEELTIASKDSLAYASCPYCARHPSYPKIYPITLHEGSRCLMCDN